MTSLLRNEEFRSVIVKLIILQVTFALIGFVLVNLFIDDVNKKIIERDMGLVGNIVRDYPELEEEIIPHITKGSTDEDKALGQAILKDYGYSLRIGKNKQPILENTSPNIQIFTALLILSSLLPLILVIRGEYKKIYGKINKVSTVAEKVVEGDFSICLNEEGDGDFYILNHQINQMANRLENTLARLNEDKIFLKDTISDISHQLKTPLSSLIMLNELLMEDEKMEVKTRKKFLEKTKAQLDRMEWLIINLLKLARLEAGAIEFKREKVFFRDMVGTCMNLLEPQLEGQNVKVGGNHEAFFYGDRDWTEEALINILKNATEYSKGEIEIKLEDTPIFSSIKIRDNGPGINEKDLPHIFERFYKSSSQLKPDSIGIGLNLAKLIVESQEGSLSVRSKKDMGTEFTLTFLKR